MKKFAGMVFLAALCLFTVNLFSAEEGKEEKKQPAFKGSKQCIMCHKSLDDATTKWEESKHAKAFEALASDDAKKFSDDPQNDPKCLKCHVTGYGEEGGYASDLEDKKKEPLVGVTCEMCHGPGGDYSGIMMKAKSAGFKLEDAEAAGLVIPKEDTCVKCHNEESPTFDKEKGFDFEEMVAKVKHGEKLKKD